MHSINLDDSSQILRIALGPLAPAEAKVDTILLESGLWTGALWARELLAEGSAISFRVAPNLVTVGLVLAGFGTGRIAILRTAIARYTGFGVGAAVGIGVVGIGAAADSHTRGVIARGVQGIDARGIALTDRQELALSCLARCQLWFWVRLGFRLGFWIRLDRRWSRKWGGSWSCGGRVASAAVSAASSAFESGTAGVALASIFAAIVFAWAALFGLFSWSCTRVEETVAATKEIIRGFHLGRDWRNEAS